MTSAGAAVYRILREELNHDGVVISVDMQMGAITNEYGFETAVRTAIEAGVDIVARTAAFIKQLVQDEKTSEARIDQSHQSLQQLKDRRSTL